METNYSVAIAATTGLVVLLSAMVAFLLSRPSDLAPRSPQ